ncbi:MAG TPA: hypothetical protein VJU77_08265 [Chthoniobacterales bacterium]|nr:hypothetical protein [Chthoniobacterales bacterium]
MKRFPLALALGLSAALRMSAAAPPPDEEQARFANLSGRELVQRLTDDEQRPRAFYELWRRAEPRKHADFKTFEASHYDSTLLVCPQEKPRPPIYLVLSCFEDGTKTESSNDSYAVKNPRELFPPVPPSPGGAAGKEQAICAFTADGRVLRPFGNDPILSSGTLADINGDGLIERVDSMIFGVEGGGTATVLTMSVVKAKAEPVLSVLLNWENDEWTYRLTDQDGDGVSDIEAGPRTAEGLIPKAVWKWDKAKRAYIGPQGKAGDHFRIINGANLWKEFARLKAAKSTFPKDLDAVSKYELTSESIVASTPPPSPAEPYQYVSLKDAPDAELIRFMAHGKSEFERESENTSRLPENFWTMDAKAAALAYVEANRTQKHREHYQIAIDDRDNTEPPPHCTIAFSDASARCYNAIDGHYFVRVDPDDSYVAFAGSSAAGVTFYNAVYDQPVFDLRICALPYEQARKLAHVLWWLDRVRSRSVITDSETERIVSTGGGRGHFVMRVNDRAVIDHANGLDYSLRERWTDDYTPETFLNFAWYLITSALPASLGQTWSQFEPTEQRPSELRETSAPVYTEAERKRLQDFSERFLGWFSLAQERISFSILSVAAQFAGDFSVVSDAPRLREIEAALPSPAPPKRSYDEISAERSKLPSPFEVKDPKKRKHIEEQRTVLDAESEAALYDDISGSPDLLRQAIIVSLRKLAIATDPARLSALAISSSDDGQWALRCLAQLDRKRYADALETLSRKTNGKWARQFYAALAQVDPIRAAMLARDLPPEKIDALTISAFLVLADAGSIPNETQRLATIIKMLHDPKTGWEERGRAIDALVPASNPLRFSGREIDEALFKLFERDQADGTDTYTQVQACKALALRGRTEYFEDIVSQLDATSDASQYCRILGVLAQLAQLDPDRFNPRLVTIVKPHLSSTNKSVSALIWLIWSADLRVLQPDVERLATRNGDEFEDRKAGSFGGAVGPLTGRFHLARKLMSLWEEPDAVTRARLLIALAIGENNDFIEKENPERFKRFEAEINRLSSKLSAEQKQKLSAFLDAMESSPAGSDALRDPEGIARKVTRLAREQFRR